MGNGAIAIGIDLDGTIVNSFERHKKLLSDIVTGLDSGFEVSELEDYLTYKRAGYSTRQYLEHKCYSNVDYIVDQWIGNIETPVYLETDRLYSFSYRYVEEMSKRCLLYLVTARKNRQGVNDLLGKYGLMGFFTGVIVVPPDHNASMKKAEKTRDKNIKYVIGDTGVDYEWAKLIGAGFFAVNYGFRSKKWWESTFGIATYSSLANIVIG